MRDWLLTCPTVRHASALAIDAHHVGLISFPTALIQAVVQSVRIGDMETGRTLGVAALALQAKTHMLHKHRPRLHVNGTTALLSGTISRDAAICQWQFGAILYLRSNLPQTIITAMVGRRLAEVVDAPLLKRRNYVITEACCDEDGCSIRFDVPQLQLPKSSPLRSPEDTTTARPRC